ncbi:MAG TPA: hypothetical protein VF469_15210 [Kofleriaceae bacterium]
MALGRFAEGGGGNLDAERAGITAAMVSAAEELAAVVADLADPVR